MFRSIRSSVVHFKFKLSSKSFTNSCKVMSVDPVTSILNSTQYVMDKMQSMDAPSVNINIDAIDSFCEILKKTDLADMRTSVEWDACGWHYQDDTPLTAQYIFVMDSLNFCFWPVQGLEYEHLAMNLRDVLLANPNAFNANNLKSMNSTTLQGWFPAHSLPQLDERVLRLQELGTVLERDYNGLASNMSKSVGGSGVELVRLVIEKLPGFRDTVVYDGKLIHFYKRAQILVSDLWAAYGRKIAVGDIGVGVARGDEHYAAFGDMNRLTMFADYRVPQILRHVGVLEYSEPLSTSIDNKIPIEFGSNWETEVRAATVQAVQMIQSCLHTKGVDVLVIEVDWLLWNQGENSLDIMKPHHRTLTIYY